MMEGTTGYRDAPARCPGCEALMEQRSIAEAIVDVCPQCKGLWVDWFDGDLGTIARDAAPLSAAEHAAVGSPSACPRCHSALTMNPHRATWHCADCNGVFVPRQEFDSILEFPPPVETPSIFQRLLDVLKALVS
jgi:Zn-finger nucleic acid-binding protein